MGRRLCRTEQWSETMNIKTNVANNGMAFSVYQSKSGNIGARLTNGNFVICSFLNVETGDALFSSHPVLSSAWSATKTDLISLGAGSHGKTETRTTRQPETVAQTEIKRGPGRPRKIAAESVTPAPVQTAPVQPTLDLAAVVAQLAAMAARQSKTEELLTKLIG